MDYDKVKRLIIAAFLAILFCVGCNIAGRVHGRKIGYNKGYEAGYVAGYDTPHPADTIYKDSTHVVIKPVPVEVTPAGMEFYPVGTIAQLRHLLDSLAAVRPDTSGVNVPIPMETKVYRDSIYEAQVSGFNPSLDWIRVTQRTAYINTPYPLPVWPSFMLSPAVAVEILPGRVFAGAGAVADYWTGRWQFSIEVGYGVNNILGPVSPTDPEARLGVPSTGIYARGQVKYNILRK